MCFVRQVTEKLKRINLSLVLIVAFGIVLAIFFSIRDSSLMPRTISFIGLMCLILALLFLDKRDKKHVQLVSALLTLIVTILAYQASLRSIDLQQDSVILSKQAIDLMPKVPPIKIQIGSTEPITLSDIRMKCSGEYCVFVEGRDLMEDWATEDVPWLITHVGVWNNGRRANNVVIYLSCDNAEFYGVINVRNSEYNLSEITRSSIKIKTKSIDPVQMIAFDVIRSADSLAYGLGSICDVTIVSDELSESYKERVLL